MRESRTVPWSSLGGPTSDRGPTVDPALFRGADDAYAGRLACAFPRRVALDARATSSPARCGPRVRPAIDALPDRQRIVITLRDVLGHTSDEVCEMLEISGANQRVLLHRARAAVRVRLASYLEVD